ncbi:MAG: hypothetical protein P4M00_22110 [Azospirillaceae bacterium]|nr:hypothetical protein [Azospirillaceae bacterium]
MIAPIRVVALAALLAALSACSGGWFGGGPSHPRQPDPYEQASRLQDKGDCAKAVALFQPLAARGRGYEMAQFNLGQCLLVTAAAASSPQEAQTQRVQAAGWIVKAADSRVAIAQEAAERLYLDGVGVAADPVEAGKWALLFKHNSLRLEVGPATADPELERRLMHQLSAAQWQQAAIRADRWQPVEQSLTLPPASPQAPPP